RYILLLLVMVEEYYTLRIILPLMVKPCCVQLLSTITLGVPELYPDVCQLSRWPVKSLVVDNITPKVHLYQDPNQNPVRIFVEFLLISPMVFYPVLKPPTIHLYIWHGCRTFQNIGQYGVPLL